ncbi:TIGR03668 family PPOX class F420-dependent oxidoreductase [Streptomyces sp. NBC_01803]|uniref:TIGR03668 family PPOX class F420-dependent oxidoreductase n=1 Tax=Streptomyces sp. NBC_01803 TaxID=2975946 RepID=UPI002DD8F398|nr:TIGR03668 family PPOX class F420-dependent oxidoreductase [Streptomyces sp. NBC_01803]WSA45319.1 TIGR03668 family PPOX class F420-dependent oxidoreductase [Streptomyces sp. NBC_01803]
MRLTTEDARRRLTEAHVLRLATASSDGVPHQVPATFAAKGETLVIAVDHKPKQHQNLKRLRNIRENPQVCVLVDVYDDDWSQLWWVRGDGSARILVGEDRRAPVEWLKEKYPQYREQPPAGPVIEITVSRWTGWSYSTPPPWE